MLVHDFEKLFRLGYLPNKGIHCHHVEFGEAHVHERFTAKPHTGHTIIAICGKGGVGKTAFSALLVNALKNASWGGNVLAIDADPAFGLAMALGVHDFKTIGQVREEIIQTAQSGGIEEEKHLAESLDYMIFETLTEMEGFSFLAMGRSEALGCYCSVNDLLRDTVQILIGQFNTIIIDAEAGLEQINRQVVQGVDDLIVITDGSARGLRTVHSIQEIALKERIVASCDNIKAVLSRPLSEEPAVLGDEIGFLGTIPFDKEVARRDAQGEPLLGLDCNDSAAAHAVYHIVEKMLS